MSSVIISGDTSGAITLAAPAVAGTNTITLPALTGTTVIAGQNSAITAGTAVASTSGTSIDFTSIPSWVKRVTVMFSGVSTSSTSNLLLQIGNGSIVTTGYDSAAFSSNASNTASTVGFILTAANVVASCVYSGSIVLALTNSSTNLWVSSGVLTQSTVPASNGSGNVAAGNKALSGTLDRVRITTVAGTDTFDAGSINILYE